MARSPLQDRLAQSLHNEWVARQMDRYRKTGAGRRERSAGRLGIFAGSALGGRSPEEAANLADRVYGEPIGYPKREIPIVALLGLKDKFLSTLGDYMNERTKAAAQPLVHFLARQKGLIDAVERAFTEIATTTITSRADLEKTKLDAKVSMMDQTIEALKDQMALYKPDGKVAHDLYKLTDYIESIRDNPGTPPWEFIEGIDRLFGDRSLSPEAVSAAVVALNAYMVDLYPDLQIPGMGLQGTDPNHLLEDFLQGVAGDSVPGTPQYATAHRMLQRVQALELHGDPHRAKLIEAIDRQATRAIDHISATYSGMGGSEMVRLGKTLTDVLGGRAEPSAVDSALTDIVIAIKNKMTEPDDLMRQMGGQVNMLDALFRYKDADVATNVPLGAIRDAIRRDPRYQAEVLRAFPGMNPALIGTDATFKKMLQRAKVSGRAREEAAQDYHRRAAAPVESTAMDSAAAAASGVAGQEATVGAADVAGTNPDQGPIYSGLLSAPQVLVEMLPPTGSEPEFEAKYWDGQKLLDEHPAIEDFYRSIREIGGDPIPGIGASEAQIEAISQMVKSSGPYFDAIGKVNSGSAQPR